MGQHRAGTFGQTRPKHRIGKIGPRLGQITDAVFDGARGSPERGELREDPPHPMAQLAPLPEFREGVGVGIGLGGVEAGHHGSEYSARRCGAEAGAWLRGLGRFWVLQRDEGCALGGGSGAVRFWASGDEKSGTARVDTIECAESVTLKAHP